MLGIVWGAYLKCSRRAKARLAQNGELNERIKEKSTIQEHKMRMKPIEILVKIYDEILNEILR